MNCLFAPDVYTIGDKINVVETEYGRMDSPICMDLRPIGEPIGNIFGIGGTPFIVIIMCMGC